MQAALGEACARHEEAYMGAARAAEVGGTGTTYFGRSAGGCGFAAGTAAGPKALVDSVQSDWLAVPGRDGRLMARAEAEWTWRDEDDSVRLYALVEPDGRGSKLDLLNRSGLVQVDIKEHLVRIVITDVANRITYQLQWLNFWAPIIPEKSNYHLSTDNKRVVLWLSKVYNIDQAGSWGHLLDVRTGKYSRSALGWPGVLCEVQGTWRSEDEEPIEIVGHQVVWPEGSRDSLAVDENDETFHLIQWGDSGKVSLEQFSGIYERHSFRFKWDDGDYWTRIPGLSLKRLEAERESLPLEYDATLARWVPWLPPDELRRQITHWLPPNGAEISVEVALADEPGLEMKRELFASADDGEADIMIADFDYLPAQLLSKCRVCALARCELEGSGLVETMLALRDHHRVSLANEAAALGALERWLQWLQPWLAPGSRRNVDGALGALKERLYEVSKDERHFVPPTPQGASAGSRGKLGRCYERWPPSWTCTVVQPNELLQAATRDLLVELRRARDRHKEDTPVDPHLAFGEARRRLAEGLFEAHQIQAAGSRRCDPLERRWARRYAEEASKYLLDSRKTRPLQRELREGGLAVVEGALDWGTLVKIRGEAARLFSTSSSEGVDDPGAPQPRVTVFCARGGHTCWAKVWTERLEELGMTGLAAAAAFLRQLPARLNDWGFGKCRWFGEDPVLWCDDGQPFKVGSQPALEWAEPEAGEPLGEPEADEAGQPVPPSRCILAFLFLNPPAWVPEWGGALRCHLPEVYRDVWGDGGRLVLLREVNRYELLPCFHAATLLMVRLQGTSVACQRAAAQAAASVPHESAPATSIEITTSVAGVKEDPKEASTGSGDGAEGEATAPEKSSGMDSVPPAEEQADEEEPAPPVEVDSHHVLQLFEASFAKAFILD